MAFAILALLTLGPAAVMYIMVVIKQPLAQKFRPEVPLLLYTLAVGLITISWAGTVFVVRTAGLENFGSNLHFASLGRGVSVSSTGQNGWLRLAS